MPLPMLQSLSDHSDLTSAYTLITRREKARGMSVDRIRLLRRLVKFCQTRCLLLRLLLLLLGSCSMHPTGSNEDRPRHRNVSSKNASAVRRRPHDTHNTHYTIGIEVLHLPIRRGYQDLCIHKRIELSKYNSNIGRQPPNPSSSPFSSSLPRARP